MIESNTFVRKKNILRPILAVKKNYVVIGSMMVVLSVLLYFTSSPFRITRKDLKFQNGCQGRLLMIVPGPIEIKIHLELEGERTLLVVRMDVTSEIFGKP